MSRANIALGEPPANLRGFPTTTINGDWFRAHHVANGPWWFAHDGEGRFDLPAPHGTCYLASHPAAAVRERLGETLVAAGTISGAQADHMVVSSLPVTTTAADTTVQKAAQFGITRELSTVTPYDLPQRWAVALHTAGHGGLRYWPRFSPGPSYRALGLFDDAGADPARPSDPSPINGRVAAKAANITVVDPPRTVPVSTPPIG